MGVSPGDASKFLDAATRAAKGSGSLLLGYFKNISNVREKSNNLGLVSEADLASEKAIVALLREHFPSHNIVAEESGDHKKASDFTWYIDPLDGTTNFVFGLKNWGLTLSLAYKGEMLVGAIYFPLSGELLTAAKGKGAFLNGKRICVSQRKTLEKSLVLFESDLDEDSSFRFPFLKNIVEKSYRIRMLGDAVSCIRFLSEGSADGVILLKPKPWDVGAGYVLITEAGGKVTGLDGKEWGVQTPDFIASNGKIHGEILDCVPKD
ncbi:inositol monophosphatase [Candidatus Woesearchaeota archaeon]|nr:inositol monophosphatase [Candidatus Woesearchaeota archaeon]